jgi:hypothetical protein
MNKLLALADRVEKLTGPDREVDCLIWCHTKGIEPRWVGTDCRLLDAGEEGIIGWIDPGKTQRNFSTNRQEIGPGSIPGYTVSLDAAVALVPEGWGWMLSQPNERAVASGLLKAWAPVMGEVQYGCDHRHAVACATAALALVAAALRARAHGGGE